MSPLSYFTDSVLRGPTIGSMLMCLAAALIGVIVFLRKQSLIGEALSHAAYPGVILGVMFAAALSLNDSQEVFITMLILLGGFLTALLGLWMIHFLEQKYRIRVDSALCFILSTFFGIGITLASYVQFDIPSLYRQAQTYLYGQAATMVDTHIYIYGILSAFVVAIVLLLDKELETISFNSDYAKSLGINVGAINSIIFILTALAIVIGIRSVGVVLMSAMLIAPAASARQFTNKFHIMLLLAAIFGLISGYLGNYLSVELNTYLMTIYPTERFILPTGPMIVLVAAFLCILSLLFAPERGVILRFVRAARFQNQCIRENLLKTFWRLGPQNEFNFSQIAKYQSISPLYLRYILRQLIQNGFLEKTKKGNYCLTLKGQHRAARVVRFHRLWEVYLVDYLGVGTERVHRNAEEIEHIITPELEHELTLLLKDPQMDPHKQRIPPREEA